MSQSGWNAPAPESVPPLTGMPPTERETMMHGQRYTDDERRAAAAINLEEPAMEAGHPVEQPGVEPGSPRLGAVQVPGANCPETEYLVPQQMIQVAPWPTELVELVNALRYREHLGWRVWLESDYVRDPADTHAGESRGLTLIVQRHGPNSYRPEQQMRVNHLFAVPPATYNRQSWMRWLFDRLGDVDTHERMEDFAFTGMLTIDGSEGGSQEILTRPYAPNHKPGYDPYMITVVVPAEDRDTDFRGNRVHPD